MHARALNYVERNQLWYSYYLLLLHIHFIVEVIWCCWCSLLSYFYEFCLYVCMVFVFCYCIYENCKWYATSQDLPQCYRCFRHRLLLQRLLYQWCYFICNMHPVYVVKSRHIVLGVLCVLMLPYFVNIFCLHWFDTAGCVPASATTVHACTVCHSSDLQCWVFKLDGLTGYMKARSRVRERQRD